jgi:tRNA(fMet)-specific endonuclease VapC
VAGRVLLDTNVVIALFAADRAVRAHASQTDIFLSSTVLGELYYGARKSGRPTSNLSRLDEFAASVAVIACDGVTAKFYGQIKDGLRLKGRPIPENDIWVAAVAIQYGLPLATRDQHFREVDGLLIENW